LIAVPPRDQLHVHTQRYPMLTTDLSMSHVIAGLLSTGRTTDRREHPCLCLSWAELRPHTPISLSKKKRLKNKIIFITQSHGVRHDPWAAITFDPSKGVRLSVQRIWGPG